MSTTVALLTEFASTTPQVLPPPPAESIFTKGENMAEDFRLLLLVVAAIIAMLIIFITTWKTKTLAGFLTSFVIGAAFVWGVENVSSSEVQDPLEDTITENGAPAPGTSPGDAIPGVTTS